MPTRTVGTWENGAIVAELDFDAGNVITNVRVTNNAVVAIFLEAQEIASGRTYASTFAANSGVTNFAIPTGQGQRLTQFINSNGKFDGLNVTARIPA